MADRTKSDERLSERDRWLRWADQQCARCIIEDLREERKALHMIPVQMTDQHRSVELIFAEAESIEAKAGARVAHDWSFAIALDHDTRRVPTDSRHRSASTRCRSANAEERNRDASLHSTTLSERALIATLRADGSPGKTL